MSQNPLFCIVCGYERSGTTLVSELLRQHPGLDGRFECGFLLVDDLAEFEQLPPFARNLKIAWGLSDQDLSYICQSPSYEIAYQRLLERSNIEDKGVRIYDKTPRYMRYLPEVLKKVDVPCIVVVRDPRALHHSEMKYENKTSLRLGRWRRVYELLSRASRPAIVRRFTLNYFTRRWERMKRAEFYDHYAAYAEAYRQAKALFPERILLVRHEYLCTNPRKEIQRIFDFPGIEYRDSYAALPENPNQYVARGGIDAGTIYEYRNGLSSRVQKQLIRNTRDYSEWHYDGSREPQ